MSFLIQNSFKSISHRIASHRIASPIETRAMSVGLKRVHTYHSLNGLLPSVNRYRLGQLGTTEVHTLYIQDSNKATPTHPLMLRAVSVSHIINVISRTSDAYDVAFVSQFLWRPDDLCTCCVHLCSLMFRFTSQVLHFIHWRARFRVEGQSRNNYD